MCLFSNDCKDSHCYEEIKKNVQTFVHLFGWFGRCFSWENEWNKNNYVYQNLWHCKLSFYVSLCSFMNEVIRSIFYTLHNNIPMSFANNCYLLILHLIWKLYQVKVLKYHWLFNLTQTELIASSAFPWLQYRWMRLGSSIFM